MMDPTRISGVALAAAIKAGQISARDAVEAHIAVLKRGRSLGALAKPRFDSARAEADAADARISSGSPDDLPPLLGVPVTVKELIAVEGMPHAGGFHHRRTLRAEADAPIVARIKEAGAIILAGTNSAGPLFWVETHNPLYGIARNPYDPRRTAGGSSGGDGVAVSIGGAAFGLGSDLGGSLRIPAMFNGIFAHLPTPGLVPNTGHFPMTAGIRDALQLGPIAHHAEDLHAALKAISGPHESHAGMSDVPLGNPDDVSITGLNVYVAVNSAAHKASPEIEQARLRAAEQMDRAGAHVSEIELPRMRRAMGYAAATVAGEMDFAATLAEIMGLPELRKRRLVHHLASSPLAVINLTETAPVKWVRTKSVRRLISAAHHAADHIAETLGDGVVLYPPFPRVAPKHFGTYLRPWSVANTTVFNFLGLPATQVPLGMNSDGLPIGVQVVAAPGNDHLCLRVAQELGVWDPPTL
ncbi:amidase [Lolliginicoccus levis]|uniref:amidase n=1 Tax=Lolliginicoccus levis TaxID=2919542 RepID=UPI00241EB9A0|nr:amidase [Lolliginicoccus levis]